MLRKVSIGFLVGSVFALVGIALTFSVVNSAWEQRQYAAEGQVGEGTVLDKRKERQNRRTHHLISYRFTTADGLVREGEGEVLSVAWDTLGPGSPVRVEYVAGSPRINRPHDGPRDEWWVQLIFFGAGTLFAAFFTTKLAPIASPPPGVRSGAKLTCALCDNRGGFKHAIAARRQPLPTSRPN